MLRRGSTGSAVRQLQRKLGVTVDGIFGRVTEQAVKDFQRKNGLQVDGIVGPKTKSALYGAANSLPGFSGGILDKVIGGILLYGIFKVLMKVF